MKKEKLLLKNISIQYRQKLYLILTNISLVLLFFEIWKIKPVIVDINDFLGLTLHLDVIYWLGLCLITICSILIYVDDELRSTSIFIFVLITLGLFLFGISILAEENTRWWDSYYPISEIKNIMTLNYIDISSKYPSNSYHYWPGYHLISIYLVYIPDLMIETMIKYMPLFNIISMIFITFSIGKKLNFSLNQCFILSFLLLSSLWITTMYYYGPQGMAYILSLLLFWFIIGLSTAREKMLSILTFMGIIITHGLTVVTAALSPLYIYSLYKKERRYIILFSILFVGWYIYILFDILKFGIRGFIEQIFSMTFYLFDNTPTLHPITDVKATINNFRISYIIIYGIYMLTSVILFMGGKIKKENKDVIKICMCWFIGIFILSFYNYFSAAFPRYYVFVLVPMICILILSLPKSVVIPLMIISVAIHIPAHYGDESFVMIRTSDIKGSEFFASLDISDTYSCYGWSVQRIWFYNPSVVLDEISDSSKGLKSKCVFYTQLDDISILNGATYVINSVQTENMMRYIIGSNPISELTNNNDKFSLIYSNRFFDIFKMI